MSYAFPTLDDFKAYFVRDFPYGTDPLISIIDSDLSKAQGQALFNFSPSFFANQGQFNIGFNFLTAHYLVMDIRASSQGISGQFEWLVSSKGVGSVSESFQIPDRIARDPNFAWLTKTSYGAKYLMLIYPQMVGQIFSIEGITHA